MTDTQDFWFPEVIGQEDGPGFLNKVLKVVGGSKTEMSWLYQPCEHTWDWNDLLKMRVDVPEVKKDEPAKGGNCVGCNLYNEYLSGPYTCYTCKQR